MGGLSKMIKGDPVIWVMVLLLSVVGLIEVYSCTSMISYKYQEGNTFFYPLKHLLFVLMGFGAMFIFSMISYKKYIKHANWLMVAGLILLFATFFSGNTTNDAKRWITIPLIGLSFQPSDLVKIILVLYLSKMLALAHVEPENQNKYFMWCIAAIGGVCLLVLPSNFSTAALIGMSGFGMLVLGKLPRKWRWGMIGLAIAGFVLFVLFAKITHVHTRFDTWVVRMETFFSGGSAQGNDFQSEQSLVAIGLGSLKGVGIGNGIQNNSLPHPYSDFIFSTIAHEMGIVGVLFVVGFYMVLFYRCVMVVKNAETLFPALFVMGLLMNIMLQALANMLVAIGFMPVTGQPLPFVSMGGTSIICTGIAVGMILNISRYSGKKETVAEIEEDVQEEEEIIDYPFMAG
jgi:cell division protein FtsW